MLHLITALLFFALSSHAKDFCEIHLAKDGVNFETYEGDEQARTNFLKLAPNFIMNRDAANFAGPRIRLTENDLLPKGFISAAGIFYFFVNEPEGVMLVSAQTGEKIRVNSRSGIDEFDYLHTRDGRDLVAFKSYNKFIAVYDLTAKREIFSMEPERIYRMAAGPEGAWPLGHYPNNPLESLRLYEGASGPQLSTNWVRARFALSTRSTLTANVDLQTGKVAAVNAPNALDHFVLRDGTAIDILNNTIEGHLLKLEFRIQKKGEVEKFASLSDFHYGTPKTIRFSEIDPGQALCTVDYEYFVSDKEIVTTEERLRRLAHAKEYFERQFAGYGAEVAEREFANFKQAYLSSDGNESRIEKNRRSFRKYFLLDLNAPTLNFVGTSNTIRKSLGRFKGSEGRIFDLDINPVGRLLLTAITNSGMTSTVVGPNNYSPYSTLGSLVIEGKDKQIAVLLGNAEFDGTHFDLRR